MCIWQTLLAVKCKSASIVSVSISVDSPQSAVLQCNADGVCSAQTEYSHVENGRYVYRIHRSPMCEYMINFILKLKQLPEKYMMNSVLENFTVLQVSSDVSF